MNKELLSKLTETYSEDDRFISLKRCLENVNLDEYKIPVVLGRNENGEIVIKDLVNIKNILIAGATGSGKSVIMSTLLSTFAIQKASPHIRLLLLDPKPDGYVEYFSKFPKTKHTTDLTECIDILKWCREEIQKRNDEIITNPKQLHQYIVITISDLADLMASYLDIVEPLLENITTKGPKVGLHIVAYTSRPSTTVITDRLKKVFNGRIGFSLASESDSKRIIEESGAEDLLGNGDMIFKDIEKKEKLHIQAPYISYDDINLIIKEVVGTSPKEEIWKEFDKHHDEYYKKAVEYFTTDSNANVFSLQKVLNTGFPFALKIYEQLVHEGIVIQKVK